MSQDLCLDMSQDLRLDTSILRTLVFLVVSDLTIPLSVRPSGLDYPRRTVVGRKRPFPLEIPATNTTFILLV